MFNEDDRMALKALPDMDLGAVEATAYYVAAMLDDLILTKGAFTHESKYQLQQTANFLNDVVDEAREIEVNRRRYAK